MSTPDSKGYITGPFVIFRRDVLEDPELSAVGRMVYVALASYATSDGKAWPSLASIARRSGLSPSTVARELNALEEKGYIVRRRRSMVGNKRLTTMYYLGNTPSNRKQPAPRPEPKPVDDNITPHQIREAYKTPETDTAVAELVEKFGGWRGSHAG